MKHRATITISTHKGCKAIHLNRNGKMVLFFTGVLLFSAVIFGSAELYRLTHQLYDLKGSHDLSMEEYTHFSTFINELTEQINERDAVFSRLERIENMIGSDTSTNPAYPYSMTLADKVHTAEHSFLQRSFILQTIPSGIPLATKMRISSHYGQRIDPVTRTGRFHEGTDFATGYGKAVLATAAGVVESIFYDRNGYGRVVKIRHDFGFTTLYAHLQSYKVKKGDYVNKGDVIALTGNSGRSTGPHLHYEVRYLDKQLNPVQFINWDMENYSSIFVKVKEVQWLKLVQNVKQKLALQEQLSLPVDLELVAN